MKVRQQTKINIPKDARLISLKYNSQCRTCTCALRVGARAHWSKSSKAVWCLDCVRGSRPPSRSSSGAAKDSSRTEAGDRHRASSTFSRPAVDTHSPWQQLCTYAQRCIEAEAVESLVPYHKIDVLWSPHSGREKLVVGESDSIPAPERLAKKLTSRTRSIIYGWPTVVLIDRDHTPKITPLFAVPTEPERSPEDQWTLQATMEPEFNLAIAASGIFDPSVTEDISDLLGQGLPFGDAEAFAALAARVAEQLGLEILSPLQAGSLESIIDRKPGVYNAAISVVAEWSGYTATLREELWRLQSCKDWPTTAAAHLIPGGFRREQQRRSPAGPLAAPLACNYSQERTLERLRTEPLTVVTGPPGTGKTQLVVNAATNAWLDGDKVLVTSTNNRAVDVAVERAEEDVGIGLLIRTGNREIREQVSDRITLASTQAATRPRDQAKARAALKRAATERTGLLEKLSRLDVLDTILLRTAENKQSLSQPLPIAARKLWTEEPPSRLPISSHEIERRARRLLRTWWFGRLRARRLRRRIGCFETAQMDQLVAWAELDQRVAKLTAVAKAARDDRQELQSIVGDPSARVSEADREWAEASLQAIQVEAAARIATGNDRLSAFSKIPANSDQFKHAISRSFHHLRGWACTALTAHSNFPLESGLFDLVIVDEASQCSLAAVLPLAFRAKRLAVVGDPYQLNPIVSLSDGLLKEIAVQTGFESDNLRRSGIHHKDGSAYASFEFAARPDTPALLSEHYRCHPHIARWFNKTFYKGELTVLTALSDVSARDRAIHWHDVHGEAARPASGSWINRAEAEEAVRQLDRVIESGYRTLGVVTPFTAQARLIDQLAETRFGRSILDEMGFGSGTAHRLQGDERDAIIFSSVLSPGMSKAGARWIEKERNLVNVAVSRARRALVVLGHPRMEQLGSVTLASLRIYLREEVQRNEHADSSSADFRTDSVSEQLLLDAMQLGDLLPYAKLGVEGYELDFALLEQGIKLNIEVDGDQHIDRRGRQRRQDIARDRVLAKLGWTVLRVPTWRCHEEIDSVIKEIRKMRDRLVCESA